MPWIVTASGHELNVAHPLPGQVDVMSIAWSLSQINRFNGHCLRPYSVAEHSLLVCEIAEREFDVDLHGQFAALMHDAHEAYAGDMHTPGKAQIGLGWVEWETRWERLVRQCFSLITAAHIHHQVIKKADLMALATERRDLMPQRATTPWPVLKDVEPVAWVRLNAPERLKAGWEDWRDRFLDRYHELEFARNDWINAKRKEIAAQGSVQ